jgi:hypothetical protein
MRIRKTNRQLVEKAIRTIEIMDAYRTQIDRYFKELDGVDQKAEGARRPGPRLLVHFTSSENVDKIVQSGRIKINDRGYISLSELHPFEFNRIANKEKPFGFAFERDKIIDNYPIVKPFIVSGKNRLIKKFLKLMSSSEGIKKAFQIDPGPTRKRSPFSYTDMMELRSLINIPLTDCILFFRNQDVSEAVRKSLHRHAIFLLPYQPRWLSKYFVMVQKWHLRETRNYVEFYDTNSVGIRTDELLAKLKNV